MRKHHFLSRNKSILASSLGDKSWEIVTALSSVPESSGSLLVSHSSSIADLPMKTIQRLRRLF
jgi:hypothetical protein